MPTVIIFRERLLAQSETFIVEQARTLRRYRPVLAGLCRTHPALSHELREVVLGPGSGQVGKAAAALFRRFPVAPGFVKNLQACSPSILHAHFATDAVQALPLAKKLSLPLVVSLHGFDVTSTESAHQRTRSGRQYIANRERLFQDATSFICVSKFIRNAAIQAGFPESKLHVHYTGIDCGKFPYSQQFRDPNLVVFVGRLVEKKGCAHLLNALHLVQKSQPAVRVEIIGDGPLRNELQDLARALGVNALFRGVQSPAEVQRSMARARVLCNPSVTAKDGDMEGFGMVFAEAQAVGTPVVSFAHGPICEAVSHGHTGLLAPEGEVPCLAQYLTTLLTRDGLWASMSERAAIWVRQNFDLRKQADTLEQLYDSCRHADRTLPVVRSGPTQLCRIIPMQGKPFMNSMRPKFSDRSLKNVGKDWWRS